MARHYVVSYDISDDKRRNEVFRTLYAFGNHAQYSVFFCELNDVDLVRLRGALRESINQHEDQVMMIDLGSSAKPLETGLEVLGRAYKPPARTLVV